MVARVILFGGKFIMQISCMWECYFYVFIGIFIFITSTRSKSSLRFTKWFKLIIGKKSGSDRIQIPISFELISAPSNEARLWDNFIEEDSGQRDVFGWYY